MATRTVPRKRGFSRLCLTCLAVAAISFLAGCANAVEPPAASPAKNPYVAWSRGPQGGAENFPIAVWLQAPANAAKYKALGVNRYVGLWKGPTPGQIAELKRHGMPVICEQNEYALTHLDEPIIVGWMHGDEPDNAQPLGQGKGYGPPVAPAKIVEDYATIRRRDPSRPVLLNLGQGVAWDGWHGRGVRTNHPEDYPEYVRGGDIVSFDIYPVVHDKPAVKGKLWYVALGVDRLRTWTAGEKPVWSCIECTHIGNPKAKPTPRQVKAEVWMAILHGARGLVYFCHQFEPRFIEAGLLADAEMSKAVAEINQQIHGLAAAINSPSLPGAVTVSAEPPRVSPDQAKLLAERPIVATARKHNGATYVFSVRMEDKPAKAAFQLQDMPETATVEVLGEGRALRAERGRFQDSFDPWAVHLYRIQAKSPMPP